MDKTFSFGPYACRVRVVARDAIAESTENAFTIADTNTARFLPSGSASVVLPSGESAKSWERLHATLGAMLDADLTRDATVIAVGGGVVCDLAACAASLYMRGCGLVLVPSTLLAMVDAALGGKTGVNLGGYKNMVGTFYPAREVRICTPLLAGLPDREYTSGLAEVIKSGLLGDEPLVQMLEEHRDLVVGRDDALLTEIVWRCIEVKGALVEADLTEQNVRAHLNLGHTFAHALESVAGLGEWSHGEAVAWGIARAMELGRAVGLTDAAYAARVVALLRSYGYRIDPLPELARRIADAMRKDKKRRGASVRFVLQRSLGQTIVTEVDGRAVDSVLAGAGA
ncbi:MAG: 3-dehydroquinate synthase [Spirochaetaceae bacterium]|nr:MAG: 3-dehydroquinate synthase [Spirochaetaceae bacterium]